MNKDDFDSKYKKIGEVVEFSHIDDIEDIGNEEPPWISIDGELYSLKWEDEWNKHLRHKEE